MTELEVIGSQISYADLRFLYIIPAERRSAGTIAQIRRHISNVVLAKKDNNAFGFFTLHSSFFT